MAPTKTIGALLALLVVASGAAAAMPGDAPVDAAQADNQTDTADGETEQDREVNGSNGGEAGPPAFVTGGESDGAAAGERGPPTDMPAPVPDFVGEIHQTINGYLNGSVDDLGAAISEITPGDGDADAAEDGTDEGEMDKEGMSDEEMSEEQEEMDEEESDKETNDEDEEAEDEDSDEETDDDTEQTGTDA